MKKPRTVRVCRVCREEFKARGARQCCDTICYQRYRNSPEYACKMRVKWREAWYRKRDKARRDKVINV